MNEIGDAGDLRGTPALVPSSIGALPVVANKNKSGMLTKFKIRNCELNEKNVGAGVLADFNNGRIFDGRWGVRTRVKPTELKDEAAEFSTTAIESEIISGLNCGVGER